MLVARFFALLRQLNGIVAGSVGMSWWRFLAYNAVGAALWVSAWGIGAYYFGETLGHRRRSFHGYGTGLIALALIAAAIVLHMADGAASAAAATRDNGSFEPAGGGDRRRRNAPAGRSRGSSCS